MNTKTFEDGAAVNKKFLEILFKSVAVVELVFIFDFFLIFLSWY